MSTLASHPGFELMWVNSSPTGPTERIRHDPQQYSAIRIPLGKSKTVSRSPLESAAAPVNDLGDTIFFPGAKVVSREHAVFEWQDKVLIIKDLGSTHGTYVARRRAKFSDSDVIVETAPLAFKKRVDGLLALEDGDLIEFGRDCHRSDNVYHPARCYLRLARPPAPAPSISPLARSGAFSVLDDVLDSDSDIVSITGDAFNRTQIERTEAPVASAATAETPHEVVDLTSDDDERNDANDCDATFDSDAASDDERASVSDAAFSELGDGVHDDIFDDTDSGSDLDDPFDFTEVPWRHEILEVVCEREELQREALDAQRQGEAYMAGYKTTQMPDSPATSVEGDSSIFDVAKARSLSPLVSLPKQVETSAETSASCAVLDAATGPSDSTNDTQPKKVEPLVPLPLKRKLDSEDTADATEEVSPVPSAAAPTLSRKASPAPRESDASITSFAASTPLPPSPSKKMRFSNDKAQDDDTRAGRAPARATPSRARKIRAIAAKTVQVTSLLSAGFLAGSLFTFKSMMNAAAAANAAGSGK
ncbi:conserved hypothetical protein [Sporisorium reilianum SRZ2]|uniref:FHA domain-containing protein n=1 Tax=Sporisorium reilianum (strain SRZ2) TaxID=999809 RepID=E6ZKR1_SPORE|nr:conserved hypothetical protein [Sporisorium reilianum SRZ2]